MNTPLSPMTGNPAPSNRPIWLAIIVIASVIIASASGLALHFAGASPAAILGGAGMTFATAMTIGMAMAKFLSG